MKGVLLILISITMLACEGAEEQKESNEKVLKEVIQQEESEPLKVVQQDVFDESQMNSKALGLCVKFKTLKGSDRGHIFKLIEDLLPSCPMELSDPSTAEPDFLNAKQRMSYNDLKEILGPPDEEREGGLIVYKLSDNSKVVFLSEPDGTVSCRVYEGMG